MPSPSIPVRRKLPLSAYEDVLRPHKVWSGDSPDGFETVAEDYLAKPDLVCRRVQPHSVSPVSTNPPQTNG